MKTLAQFLAETGEALGTDPAEPLRDDVVAENLDASTAAYLTKHQLTIASYDAARLLHAVTREKISIISAQQVRAAIAILDRTGFGPRTEVALTNPEDLEKLTDDQLLQRIDSLRQYLLSRRTQHEESSPVH